jgi:hypothetical protein
MLELLQLFRQYHVVRQKWAKAGGCHSLGCMQTSESQANNSLDLKVGLLNYKQLV